MKSTILFYICVVATALTTSSPSSVWAFTSKRVVQKSFPELEALGLENFHTFAGAVTFPNEETLGINDVDIMVGRKINGYQAGAAGATLAKLQMDACDGAQSEFFAAQEGTLAWASAGRNYVECFTKTLLLHLFALRGDITSIPAKNDQGKLIVLQFMNFQENDWDQVIIGFHQIANDSSVFHLIDINNQPGNADVQRERALAALRVQQFFYLTVKDKQLVYVTAHGLSPKEQLRGLTPFFQQFSTFIGNYTRNFSDWNGLIAGSKYVDADTVAEVSKQFELMTKDLKTISD